MKQILLCSLAFLVFFQSCKKECPPDTSKIFKGKSVSVGDGNVWSWVEVSRSGQPKTIGITFEEAAFTNLPTSKDGSSEYDYEPTLPLEKQLTPFNHIVVDWNPNGHPPIGIYDKPHFDLHFYMMSEEARLQIPEYAEDSSGFLQYPAPAYFPPTYFPIPGGEPQMGVHWADATSPELDPVNPQPFTQTFIYGSYAGNVTFYEPMATLTFLTTTTSFTRDIPQPSKWAKEGYYPTKLSFTKTDGTMQVTLHDFVYREKS